MKNLKLLLIFTLITLTTLFTYSCQKDSNKTNSSEIETTNLRNIETALFTSFNLPFPIGTEFELNENELKFTLPEPYYILGISAEGNLYRSVSGGSGGITCNCTKGSGCDPIKSGGDYGCLMKDGCYSCNKSTSSISGLDVELVEMIIMNPEYGIGIDSFSQLNNKSLLPESFMEAEEIVDLITGLNSLMNNPTTHEKKVVLLNAFGYILPLEIPSDLDNTSIYFRSNSGGDTGAGVSCSCNIAGKSCPKESKFGVVWCNSNNCTSCSMSGRLVDKNGIEKIMKVSNGRIVIE